MLAIWIRTIKITLAGLLTTGMLFGTGCGMTDIRDNIVAGGLGFVKAFTGDLLDAALPDVNEIFNAVPDNQA